MSAVQPDDALPDDPQSAAPPSNPERADWLVGPEEGLAAELARSEGESGDRPRPTLLRPAASSVPPPPPADPVARVPAPPIPAPLAATRRPGMVVPDAEDSDGFERGPGNMSWEPGARSVPSLRRGPAPSHTPAPTHDFPMDDAEERVRGTAPAHAPAKPDAERDHAVVSPEAFDVNVVPMPWWMQALHTLRTDRRTQVLLGVMLVVLATVALWPRGERPVSIASLRRHANGFDGTDVKVAGRVGQVFRVGGGFAYYLHDGRDTLVVFTRGREPQPRQQLTVHGTMSTGYLDGQSTLALFEKPAP